MNSLMEKYDYEYIRTPHFEVSELFHRGVGDTTDIVSKETYDFIDRGERNMTLRPEGTAGVVRSYIENKMYGEFEESTISSTKEVNLWLSGIGFLHIMGECNVKVTSKKMVKVTVDYNELS